MKRRRSFLFSSFILSLPLILLLRGTVNAADFEGRINVTVTRGNEVQTLLYIVGTNCLRIERGETNWPYARNLINRDTGEVTLLFPHNRSFVRLKSAGKNPPATPSDFPAVPMPVHIGPQAAPPAGIGSTNLPIGMPAPPAMPQMPSGVGPQGGSSDPNMPAMPMMPMMMMEKTGLEATGEKTNLLGFACEKFVVRQRGEIMEIWATDQLLPFHNWLQNQPPRFGPRMIEEQWGEWLKTKKLFPLLAVLRFEAPLATDNTAAAKPGPERMRFEVRSVTPKKITDAMLFQPPPDYQEIQPLPF